MRVRVLVIALLLPAAVATLSADDRSEAKKHVEFGIQVAQHGLWREAILQWERAIELDPTYSAAYNNLAIAYEQEGQPDKARAAYEQAVKLDPRNSFIRQNYELFREIDDRATRQRSRSR